MKVWQIEGTSLVYKGSLKSATEDVPFNTVRFDTETSYIIAGLASGKLCIFQLADGNAEEKGILPLFSNVLA